MAGQELSACPSARRTAPMPLDRAPALESWIKGPLKYAWLRLEAKLCTDHTTTAKLVGIRLFIGPDRILKRCRSPAEVTAMIYVSQKTSIPVPKVLDTFFVGGHRYIVMEYLRDAPSLKDAWRTLSADQREALALEVIAHIRELRALSPPSPEAVCSATGGPLFDVRVAHGPFGPYDTHKDFHYYIGFTRQLQRYGDPETRPGLEQKTWRSVFSHCDLAPRNILVRDGHVAAIIDWEFSGWYPEYMEYSCMQFACWNAPEWCARICRDFDCYEDEWPPHQSWKRSSFDVITTPPRDA